MKNVNKMSMVELVSTYRLKTEIVKVAEESQRLCFKQYIENYVEEGTVEGMSWTTFECRGHIFQINRYEASVTNLVPEGCGKIPETVEDFQRVQADLKFATKQAVRALMAMKYIKGEPYV